MNILEIPRQPAPSIQFSLSDIIDKYSVNRVETPLAACVEILTDINTLREKTASLVLALRTTDELSSMGAKPSIIAHSLKIYALLISIRIHFLYPDTFVMPNAIRNGVWIPESAVALA